MNEDHSAVKRHSVIFLAAFLAVALLIVVPTHVTGMISQDAAHISIRFHANGGSGEVPEPLSGVLGQTVTVPEAPRLRPPGSQNRRVFTGWSTLTSASAPRYCPGDTVTLLEDEVFYAVYTGAVYTVRFQVGDKVTREQVPPGECPTQVPDLAGAVYGGWTDSSGQALDPAVTRIWRDQTFTAACQTTGGAVSQLTLKVSGVHTKYMDGDADGLFQPSRALTRGEFAQLLYNVVEERPSASLSFPDVEAGDWYVPAVGAVSGLGLMSGSGGVFRPGEAVTRAECAAALVRLIPASSQARERFDDVPESFWAYDAISRAAGYGLFSGDGQGKFNPDGSLLRAEAATVFNRLLGRSADRDRLAQGGGVRIFPDVPADHWAYAQVMEASVSHSAAPNGAGQEVWSNVTEEKTSLPDGFYRIGGWLYQVRDGFFLHDTTAGVFTFDHSGRYTTGDSGLDQRLNAIVEEQTDSSMTRDQKLRALYNYVRDNYRYLKRPNVTKGQTGWEAGYALEFLENGKGNCFSFAACYCLLCRELGLPACTVVGDLAKAGRPHGWVEIELDGATYIFDTQLAWLYLHERKITKYNFFKLPTNKTPFKYIR